MIRKKVCMVGSFAVGKTSLVRRYVEALFSDKYHTTVGVKVDKKTVPVDGTEVELVLWDIAGEDDFHALNGSYLRGSSGYLLVADGTRGHTLDKCIELQGRALETTGEVPFALALNKVDLSHSWDLNETRVAELLDQGWIVRRTSAKTGEGVEELFHRLARRLLAESE